MGVKSDSEGQYRDAKLAKICKYDCRQKKKMQTSAKSIFQFFARLHFLTQFFAHSCNH